MRSELQKGTEQRKEKSTFEQSIQRIKKEKECSKAYDVTKTKTENQKPEREIWAGRMAFCRQAGEKHY